jgi:hypothetical protein
VLVVFNVCLPNAKEVGDRLAEGPVPVPVKVTRWGLPLALSVTERVALRAAATVGLNVTLIVQFAPAARLEAHVFVKAKSPGFAPEMAMLVIVRDASPVFDRVTLRAALVVLTGWFPNAREDGLREAIGTAILVKFTPVTLALLIVTARLVGVNVYPAILGVTV